MFVLHVSCLSFSRGRTSPSNPAPQQPQQHPQLPSPPAGEAGPGSRSSSHWSGPAATRCGTYVLQRNEPRAFGGDSERLHSAAPRGPSGRSSAGRAVNVPCAGARVPQAVGVANPTSSAARATNLAMLRYARAAVAVAQSGGAGARHSRPWLASSILAKFLYGSARRGSSRIACLYAC